MNLRVLPIFLLVAVLLAAPAFADLEIKTARYGTTSSYRDVRDVLTAFLRNNTLSFPVNARSMGGDPTPRERDSLYIEYRAGGRDYTETVAEGGIFTFHGLGNVEPARPFLNLPFLHPPTPLAVPLLIINRSSLDVVIYSIDRYGTWVWVADMNKDQTITLSAQVGQEWIAADSANHILARQKIARVNNTLWVNEPGTRTPVSGYRGEEAWVRFENAHYSSLYLYNLDSQGRWNWMATIEPGGGYSASTSIGELWIATDTSNRVIRQVTVAPGLSHVKIN